MAETLQQLAFRMEKGTVWVLRQRIPHYDRVKKGDYHMKKRMALTAMLASSVLVFTGCGGASDKAANSPAGTAPAASPTNASGISPAAGSATQTPKSTATAPAKDTAPAKNTASPAKDGGKETDKGNAEQTAAHPESITVLVNKQYALPANYEPDDLVYPNVSFTFKEQSEKKKMRKEAAGALETLFAGAKKDGVTLLGVSAYRSYATQTTLFNNYVKKDGKEKAMTYSAPPGHSEHETGLAIDVTGGDGKCAAEDCFAGTKEAKWLAEHADEYGFIIRFPKGKESVTGYQYEPWHIRYVGKDTAKEIADKSATLEEYMNAVPVNK